MGSCAKWQHWISVRTLAVHSRSETVNSCCMVAGNKDVSRCVISPRVRRSGPLRIWACRRSIASCVCLQKIIPDRHGLPIADFREGWTNTAPGVLGFAVINPDTRGRNEARRQCRTDFLIISRNHRWAGWLSSRRCQIIDRSMRGVRNGSSFWTSGRTLTR